MKHISIVGLGAVGAIYAWRLTEFLGKEHVRIVVDENRLERYKSQGVKLNGKRVDFHYVLPHTNVEPADLILVCTKNHHLEEALQSVASHVGKYTVLLSLLNGIDSEEVMAKHFGADKVLYGFTTALDSTRTGNQIDFSTEGIIYMGEKDNSRSARIEALSHLFEQAGISSVVPDDIKRELWVKFMVNVSINTISAITRATYGDCATVEPIRTLIAQTMREVVNLAQKVGIHGLDESYIAKYQKIFASLEFEGKTSMLQDVEALRETENQWFCLRASQLAKKVGVATPLIDVLGTLVEGIDATGQRKKAACN